MGGSYSAAGSGDAASQISKLEEEERELQKKLKDLQNSSSGQSSDEIQQQQMLLQKQISQVQQQIKQLQNQQSSSMAVNQLGGTEYAQQKPAEYNLLDTYA